MKTKYAIIIILTGIGFHIVGALFKIMHWPLGGLILFVASILEAVGIILFMYKLLTYPKFKDFLNW